MNEASEMKKAKAHQDSVIKQLASLLKRISRPRRDEQCKARKGGLQQGHTRHEKLTNNANKMINNHIQTNTETSVN